jgi:hypothetical protein
MHPLFNRLDIWPDIRLIILFWAMEAIEYTQ